MLKLITTSLLSATVATAVFSASPATEAYFGDKVPKGDYQMIPLGEICFPHDQLETRIADLNPPEFVVAAVPYSDDIGLILTRPTANAFGYTVFAHFLGNDTVCVVEFEGSTQGA